MAKKKKPTEKKITEGVKTLQKYEREVEGNKAASARYMSEIWEDAEDKEKLFFGTLNDDISKNIAKSSVFDPRLSTAIFERAARVTAREHVGYSQPVSGDDKGKSRLMDLQLDYYAKCANSQYSMGIKNRIMAVYSAVYGSMFAMVPWKVDPRRDKMGPDLEIIPLQNVFPQPNLTLNDADYVGVRTYVSLEWLKKQNKDVWQGLDALVKEYETGGGDQPQTGLEESTFVEREFHPNRTNSDRFPMVELYTEFRLDKWITLAIRNPKIKGSRTRVVRVVESQMEGMLPVVARHAFPVLGRAVGFGEIERNSTLAKGINSLWNLYLDGVKFSIFPPIQINPNGLDLEKRSIVMSPGARWLTGRPNQDIQVTNVSPAGINTFTSTYSAMVGALNTSAGTTSVNSGDNVESTLGKSPAAIRNLENRQNARDLWDQKMQEDFIRDVYTRWQQLIINNQEQDVVVRLFGKELNDISQRYPDVVEFFGEMGESGQVVIPAGTYEKNMKYDYHVEVGSTVDSDPAEQGRRAGELLNFVTANPQYIQEMEARHGKTINKAELMERVLSTSGIENWDDILVDVTEIEQQNPQMQQGLQQPPQMQSREPFQDPEVAAMAEQIFGGASQMQ
jgi:hypothetical protein